MAIVTRSIGTSSRDYSTIAAWEADLDDTGIYNAGDDAVGECYNDSAFDEQVDIANGGTVGLNSIELTAASGERHDGTAGTGARIVYSSTGIIPILIAYEQVITVSWLDVDINGQSVAFGNSAIEADDINAKVVRNCLIHDSAGGNNRTGGAFKHSTNTNGDGTIQNSIIYDISGSGVNDESTLEPIGSGAVGYGYHNVTCHNNTTTVDAVLKSGYDIAGATVENVLSVSTNSGSDFGVTTPSNATVNTNLSSDSSAPGAIAADPTTAANEFVSTTGGSEDLHLASGADAIDAGTDLVTTPANVQIDIDGRDRDAQGDTWDIGADEFVAAGGSIDPAVSLYSQRFLRGAA